MPVSVLLPAELTDLCYALAPSIWLKRWTALHSTSFCRFGENIHGITPVLRWSGIRAPENVL